MVRGSYQNVCTLVYIVTISYELNYQYSLVVEHMKRVCYRYVIVLKLSRKKSPYIVDTFYIEVCYAKTFVRTLAISSFRCQVRCHEAFCLALLFIRTKHTMF